VPLYAVRPTPCGSLHPKLYPPRYDLQLRGWVGG